MIASGPVQENHKQYSSFPVVFLYESQSSSAKIKKVTSLCNVIPSSYSLFYQIRQLLVMNTMHTLIHFMRLTLFTFYNIQDRVSCLDLKGMFVTIPTSSNNSISSHTFLNLQIAKLAFNLIAIT